MDVVLDPLANGRRLKVLTIADVRTDEAINLMPAEMAQHRRQL